ncbi:MAG: hypothetical protein R3C61_00900 [Bacteroidia bacterium]
MIVFLLTLGAISCFFSAWQDFRNREIHIAPLGLYGLAGMCYRLLEDGWSFWGEWLLNLTIETMMLGTAWVGYRLRGEKRIMDVKIGWGDAIFLALLGIWLKPYWF